MRCFQQNYKYGYKSYTIIKSLHY